MNTKPSANPSATGDYDDTFTPAEDDPGSAEFVRGFIAGLFLAGITAGGVLLVMLKVPQ